MEEPAKPKLNRLSDFQEILETYSPSQSSIDSFRSTVSLFVIGTTGSGRNTLIEELLETGGYYFVRSNTTRPRRMHNGRLEHNGEFYWHITEDEFLNGLKEGLYLEAAIIHKQQVSGSIVTEYQKAGSQGLVAVTDIEGIYGPETMRRYNPKAHFVFILPPVFPEWMARWEKRGQLPPEERHQRLLTSQEELKIALGRDYYSLIISGDLAHNVDLVKNIVESEQHILTGQDVAKVHAEALLVAIDKELAATS